MTPLDNGVPSRLDRAEADLQAHARSLTVLTEELRDAQQDIALIKTENRYRDEKVSGITSLGRTTLIAVITLFIGAVFAFLASGGFRVLPPT